MLSQNPVVLNISLVQLDLLPLPVKANAVYDVRIFDIKSHKQSYSEDQLTRIRSVSVRNSTWWVTRMTVFSASDVITQSCKNIAIKPLLLLLLPPLLLSILEEEEVWWSEPSIAIALMVTA
uniref:SUS5 n=1 Tax=Arundo donax TaxID=35708 RepID=A0A0A9DIR6_ARUDO